MKRLSEERITFGLEKITAAYKKLPKYYKRLLSIYYILIAIILAVVTYSVLFYRESRDDYSVFAQKTVEFDKFKDETDVIFDTMNVIAELIYERDITTEYSREERSVYARYNFERMYNISRVLKKLQTDFSGYNLNIALTRATDGIVITGDGTTEDMTGFISETGIDIIKAASVMSEFENLGISSKIIPKEKISGKIDVVFRKNYPDSEPVYIILSFVREDIQYFYDKKTECGYIFSGYSKKYENEIIKRIAEENFPEEMKYGILDRGSSVFFVRADTEPDNLMYVKIFFEEKKNIPLIAILWIVFLLTVPAILASILAKFSYLPLRSLLHILGIDSEGSIDEVTELENRISYIMDNNMNMSAAIGSKDRIIRNHFLFDLLNGFVWGKQIEEFSREHSLEFLMGDVYVMLLEEENAAPPYDAERLPIMAELAERIEEAPTCVCLSVSERQLAVICMRDELICEEVFECIEHIRSTYNISITAAYGIANAASGEIAKAYRILMNGMNNKVLTTRKNIITIDDIRAVSGDSLVYSTETEKNLIEYCENGEKEKALYCLKSIFDANISAKEDVFELLKYALTITAKRIFANLSISEEDVFDSRFDSVDEITNAETFDKLFTLMKDMVCAISEYVSENSDSEEQKLGSEILSFINENLENDIGIADISKVFGISPSYIGKILRKNYNTSFKQYIDEVRIKKAKQMMDENKNILIKDLADSLGYNNVVSFIRMFKKSEGISPGQYMKMK